MEGEFRRVGNSKEGIISKTKKDMVIAGVVYMTIDVTKGEQENVSEESAWC